jgi:hypothetical protein
LAWACQWDLATGVAGELSLKTSARNGSQYGEIKEKAKNKFNNLDQIISQLRLVSVLKDVIL